MKISQKRVLKLFIAGKNIDLKLLTKEELFAWVKNKKEAEELFEYKIDAEKIEGRLLYAFKKKIENMSNDPGNEMWYSYYAIICKETIIGLIGPKGKPDSRNHIEIGFGVSEKYRNKGIATEAVGLFCKWYFENTKVNAIIAETTKGNIPSLKVLQKNAFQVIKEENMNILWKLKR